MNQRTNDSFSLIRWFFQGDGMGSIITFYKLEEALGEPGCPICRLTKNAVANFLDDLIYERVNDPGTRDDLLRSMGFCNKHAWQLVDHGGALGIAIIHRDLVKRAMDEIGSAKFQSARLRVLQRGQGQPPNQGLTSRLGPRRKCPACSRQESVENLYLHELVERLDEVKPLLRGDNGLCVPHFRKALSFVKDKGTFRLLVEWEASALEHIYSELSELIRKSDYRFADEGTGTEGDSWQRGVAIISGER